MPGEAEGQPDDNQRQPRRQGQGNCDQARDNQDRPRDHPGRLDKAEHTFKVTNSCSAQVAPIGYLTMSSKGDRRPGLMLRSYAPIILSGFPMLPPLSSVSLVNVSTCQHIPSWRIAPSCPLSRFTRVPFYRNKSPCVPVRTNFKSSFVVV